MELHWKAILHFLLICCIIVWQNLAFASDLSTSNESSFSFDDSILYKIKWSDPALEKSGANNETIKGEELIFTSENMEKYRCMLPVLQQPTAGDSDSSKKDDLNPYQLLKPLFAKKFCSYRVENYWTYEVCHGKFIRQFHEDPASKRISQEYYLGTFDLNNLEAYEKQFEERKAKGEKVPMVNVDELQLPYIEINMTDGTPCDLFNKKRNIRVLYVCMEEGKHELFSIKETSTCEYESIAFSPLLCLSQQFKLKHVVENDINCYPLDSSPRIPKGFELSAIEEELEEHKNRVQKNSIENLLADKAILVDANGFGKEIRINVVTRNDPSERPFQTHSHVISMFLTGQYCLTGGSGWWKYEFCYGKSVNQFHEEKDGKKVINLGNWDLEEHKKWIENNPSKAPSSDKTPKQISHFYSSGEMCEESNKARTVEVKLKCRYGQSSPDSVSLFLMEPKTCEYILGVESPIICDLLSTVDKYGIFQATSVDNY